MPFLSTPAYCLYICRCCLKCDAQCQSDEATWSQQEQNPTCIIKYSIWSRKFSEANWPPVWNKMNIRVEWFWERKKLDTCHVVQKQNCLRTPIQKFHFSLLLTWCRASEHFDCNPKIRVGNSLFGFLSKAIVFCEQKSHALVKNSELLPTSFVKSDRSNSLTVGLL